MMTPMRSASSVKEFSLPIEEKNSGSNIFSVKGRHTHTHTHKNAVRQTKMHICANTVNKLKERIVTIFDRFFFLMSFVFVVVFMDIGLYLDHYLKNYKF